MYNSPLVSILCISMNHEKYIEKSFLSVVNQTYSPFEVLYVDNYSSDRSFQIGDAIFKNSGLPYKGFKRERIFGISENINFLINHAVGKYISIISGDDWWELNNIDEKIQFYEQHPYYGMLYGGGFFYFHDTGKIKIEKSNDYKSGWVLKDVLKRNFLNSVGAIIKMETINKVGLFDEASPLEDWDMWIRIAEKYEIGLYKKPLVYYGKQTGSNISESNAYMNSGYNYIFKKYSHYKEIDVAIQHRKLLDLYDDAAKRPNFKNLLHLFKNYQFTFLHFKQVVKCILVIFGIKIKLFKKDEIENR